MFRWLRKRRERKQQEAAERRAQLRRKAQLSSLDMAARQPGSYRPPEVIPFYMTLAPDQPDELAAIVAVEVAPVTAHQPFTASADYAPVKTEQELPRRIDAWAGGGSGGTGNESSGGGSGRHNGTQHHYGNGDNVGGNRHVTQHHYGSGDNIGGSGHHASHHASHSSHDYSSTSSSYDSSSYDSGGSSGGGDSSW